MNVCNIPHAFLYKNSCNIGINTDFTLCYSWNAHWLLLPRHFYLENCFLKLGSLTSYPVFFVASAGLNGYFSHWTINFNPFRPFQGPPNSLKELLGSAPPQDDPHANKAAFPRESWQDQVWDVWPGAAHEEELSDSSVMLHQEKHLQITKQSFWQEGKEPLLNNHPNKASFLPLGSCFLLHKLGESISQTPFLPPAAQAAESSPDLGFLVGLWWASCTEQHENLGGTAWLVSCLSEERRQDRLTLTVTGMGSVTAWQHPGLQLQSIHGDSSGPLDRQRLREGLWDFHQQNRGEGKSMSSYLSH